MILQSRCLKSGIVSTGRQNRQSPTQLAQIHCAFTPSPARTHLPATGCSPAGLGIFTRPNTPIARPKKSQALKLPSPKQGLRPVCTELLPQQHIIIHRPINPSTHSTHVTTNYTYTLMSVRCLAGYRPTEVSVYPGNSQIQPDQHQPRWQAVGSVLLCQKYTRLPRVSRKEKKKRSLPLGRAGGWGRGGGAQTRIKRLVTAQTSSA